MPHLQHLVNVAVSVFPLSLVVFIYERALVPIYGSVPTNHLLDKILVPALVISAVQPFAFSLSQRAFISALLFAAAPNATYWVAIWSARNRDPLWGPAATHVVVLVPMVVSLSSFMVGSRRKASRILRMLSHSVQTVVIPLIALRITKKFWSQCTALNALSESFIFLVLSVVFLCLSITQMDISPAPTPKSSSKIQQRKSATSFTPLQTKFIILSLAAALSYTIYPKLYSPVLPHPLPQPYTHPSYPLQIHSSVQSTTGLIVVGQALTLSSDPDHPDNQMSHVRYLRAAHSFLGGVWMGPKVMTMEGVAPLHDSHNHRLGDSIYGVFTLQEAARLVNSTAKNEWENALVIGLGAGISATSFHRHNMSLTIVEIDPAVYDAARQWFGLPDPGPKNVYLEDARSWAAHKRASADAGVQGTLYDIVVHDCFSGGAVPEHIYTMEFWSDLKSTIHPEGVLVVNFVGHVKSEAMRMILYTLSKAFGQCRAFHDVGIADLSEDQYETEYINIVFFCTMSRSPLTFRNPTSEDFLGSPLRRYILSTLNAREINLNAVKEGITAEEEEKYILTDENNPLGRLQDAQGHYHWTLMRDVLPDIFWETY
ncbi:spermidine synthase [Guyanagaster necrorhizus]|uniref:Spermidine synthase n=1 Tax=Guyanagaster necrorhizus TaxID=856835 RepID=A0A9P8AVF3_9AGAR|nr:spermidine synthase [Guyanagaster necrorhizus MCA 3950]KAG7449478.1 spermidine synthase [Guyanagaster necrorhizus MCA 3950]